MPYQIRPEDRLLVDEFRRQPYGGRYSPDLQRILNLMRSAPMEGKYILLCTRPFAEWKLARHHGRKKPIEVFHDQVFHSREEAEWAVFRLRWKELTGDDLN
ncbi:MAG: hypothetical protein U1E45_09660 [Geminicoccaceae bacterium]